MNTSEKVNALKAEMIALRKQIIQFMKIHNNPHDTCKHDEMAKKLQLIEQILKGGKAPTTGTTDQTTTDTTDQQNTDQPTTDTTDQPTTGQPTTGGDLGNLGTLKDAVEQARAGAKEALATVQDLNAKQITIDDAEKEKIKAYVAKADEFLQAYESAEEAQKTAFDGANSGYVAEIKQSRDWNADDFLPRTEAQTTDDTGSNDTTTDNENPSTGVGGYKNTTGKLLYEDKAVAKHGQEFITKLKDVCSRLGLEPDFLMATIDAECNFDHRAVNPSSGATGLIQFMPDTAASLGTSTSAIRNMSAVQQLEYVYKYFKSFGNLAQQISEPAESYLIVFYPRAVGESDDFVLGSEVSPRRVAIIAQQNGIYDLNKDGKITKGEVMEYMRKNKYKEAYDMMAQVSDDGDNSGEDSGDNSDDGSGSTSNSSTETPDNTSSNSGGGLSGSVGQGGDNNPSDVRKVQDLLKKKGYSLGVDGEIGPETIGVIGQFQRNIFNGWSDGLVEPGGKTWQTLNGSGGEYTAPEPISSGPGGKPNWIAIAERELGVKEIVGGQHNPRVIEYHATTGGWQNDEVPWCASFVTWVMKQAGVDGGFKSALAQDWARYGKAATGPAYGAIAVIPNQHVGFVVGKQGSNIILLGGNQGNMVKKSVYSASSFAYFRFPSNYNIPASAYSFTDSGGSYDANDTTT